MIKVRMIAQAEQNGQSLTEIAEFYEIPLADVHGALAYYLDNQGYFDDRDRENERLRASHAIPFEKHRAEIEQ